MRSPVGTPNVAFNRTVGNARKARVASGRLTWSVSLHTCETLSSQSPDLPSLEKPRGSRTRGTLTRADHLPSPAGVGSDGSLHYGSGPPDRQLTKSPVETGSAETLLPAPGTTVVLSDVVLPPSSCILRVTGTGCGCD